MSVAQVGVEPTASLVLSESGRPIAYRANSSFPRCPDAQSGSRTHTHSGLSRAALPIGASGPRSEERHGSAASSSGRRTRTFIAWFRARKPTISRSPNKPDTVVGRECPVGVEPTSPVWKTGTFAARPRAHKAEGEGVEPSRLIARPGSGRMPSPIGLPFRESCGGRSRTCKCLLNREVPYRWATPQEVRTVGVEPTLSGSRNRRIPRLSYVLNESTQRELNPHVLHGEQAGCRYITGASISVGPDGLEPSPNWLRARHAAANTLVPQSYSGPGRRSNPRLRFFRPPLLCLSYQPNEKGQMPVVTSGLKILFGKPDVTSAMDTRAEHWPTDQPIAR